MRVIRGYQATPRDARGAAAAIGNFDGVHGGHRSVLARARERALGLGAPLGVVTFEPHPREVLWPDNPPARLTPLRAKIELLAESGVEQLFVLPFNDRLRTLSAEAFARDVLAGGLGLRHVVVGANFRFGHRARGDATDLAAWGGAFGFGVDALPLVTDEGLARSSTRVRALVAEGRAAEAAALLGRPHRVTGRVVEGDRRGRTIGFPTANLRLAPAKRQLLPTAGVYAVRARLDDEGRDAWRDGVANLGWRPTFDGRELRLEIHLLDFAGDLYGRRLTTGFVGHLRGERRFDGPDSLKRQIAADSAEARRVLGREHGGAGAAGR